MRNNNTTTLLGNIILANTDNNQFTFAGATPTELACVHGVTSSIQTQLDSCIKNNSTRILTGNINLTNTNNNTFTFCGASPT